MPGGGAGKGGLVRGAKGVEFCKKGGEGEVGAPAAAFGGADAAVSYQIAVDGEAFLVAGFGVPGEGGGGGEAAVTKEDGGDEFGREPGAVFARSAERVEQGIQEFGGIVRWVFC